MNWNDRKTLIHIQHIIGRKPTEKELKAYDALEKVLLGDPVKKTGIYADKNNKEEK